MEVVIHTKEGLFMKLMDMDFLDELREIVEITCYKYKPALKSMGMDYEDVVGSVALKLVRNQVEYDPKKASLRRFLSLIVNRYCIDVLKNSKSVKRPYLLFYGMSNSEEFAGLALEEEETVFKDFLFEDLMDTVVREEEQNIGSLDFSEMIRMRLDGYKLKEIADTFRVSTTTITAHLNKARRLKSLVV